MRFVLGLGVLVGLCQVCPVLNRPKMRFGGFSRFVPTNRSENLRFVLVCAVLCYFVLV